MNLFWLAPVTQREAPEHKLSDILNQSPFRNISFLDSGLLTKKSKFTWKKEMIIFTARHSYGYEIMGKMWTTLSWSMLNTTAFAFKDASYKY